MLIDGGPIGSYEALESRIAALPANERLFELMVLSHVDTDHIEGMVRFSTRRRITTCPGS